MTQPRNRAPVRVLLRARVVLPVTQPPVPDGAVVVDGGQIAVVGAWKTLRSLECDSSVDLGEVVLLPGLINAHAHLDYTDMAGQINPPRSFSDWIKAVLALKAQRCFSDYAMSWLQGAKMLLAHGTTTVANVEAVPELLPEVLTATPLRVCSLLELTGVRSRRPPAEILQTALDKISSLPARFDWAGLSPHAPYSTKPELLRLTAKAGRQRDWLVTTHVAESAEEFEMFQSARGPMFEWLKPQRDMSDCGRGSPVQHLERCGLLGGNLLAVHTNYLAPGDADRLGRNGVSVVHCPRTHRYFGHDSFPRQQLAAAGVNVCLGTDSLASVRSRPGRTPRLDMLAEMRAMIDSDRALIPDALLQMATVNGAKALGMAGKLGELTPGALADLITIPFAGRERGACQAVLRHNGPVSGVMIHGRWIVPPARR